MPTTPTTRRTTSLALAALATLAVSAATPGEPPVAPPAVPPAEPARPIAVVPGRLELGGVEPGVVVEPDVWLINRSDEPVTVLAAKGSCGCTAVDFRPGTLEPSAARQVKLRIRTPREAGRRKSVNVTFTLDGAPPLRLPVKLETARVARVTRTVPSVAPTPEPDAEVPAPTVLALPGRGSVWVINTGETARTITAIKPSCGCTTVVGGDDARPRTVAPGHAAEIRYTIDRRRLDRDAAAKAKTLSILIDGGETLTVPIETPPRAET